MNKSSTVLYKTPLFKQAQATTNSQLFKQAHAMTKQVIKANDCYRVTFGACLKLLVSQSKATAKSSYKIMIGIRDKYEMMSISVSIIADSFEEACFKALASRTNSTSEPFWNGGRLHAYDRGDKTEYSIGEYIADGTICE